MSYQRLTSAVSLSRCPPFDAPAHSPKHIITAIEKLYVHNGDNTRNAIMSLQDPQKRLGSSHAQAIVVTADQPAVSFPVAVGSADAAAEWSRRALALTATLEFNG